MGKAVRRPFAAHRSALGALPEFWLRLGGYHQKHEPAPRTRVPPELQGFTRALAPFLQLQHQSQSSILLLTDMCRLTELSLAATGVTPALSGVQTATKYS